ncbi:hypothetical protein HD554DRAFT_214543 [Boletus coccyginus]|nr:hypothetical protein HD554DRAFT_214543 [Boletus coccyginus]
MEYLPFGHGKYTCPGRSVAANELTYMLAHVVMSYDVKLEDSKARRKESYSSIDKYKCHAFHSVESDGVQTASNVHLATCPNYQNDISCSWSLLVCWTRCADFHNSPATSLVETFATQICITRAAKNRPRPAKMLEPRSTQKERHMGKSL